MSVRILWPVWACGNTATHSLVRRIYLRNEIHKADCLIENEIVGEALVALKHEELREMGIASVGHRLTILKHVYQIKLDQDIPIDSDHYIPLCTLQVFSAFANSPTDSSQLLNMTHYTSSPRRMMFKSWLKRSFV